MWLPAMALGLSIRISEPWQAFQAELRSSSSQPRNCGGQCHVCKSRGARLTFAPASFRKENVMIPFSTHSLISSAGSPSTGAKSMPCFLIQGSNSACVAIFGRWPSAKNPLQSAIYGCTSPRDPIVRHVILIDSVGLKQMIEARGSSNSTGGASGSEIM